MDAFKLTGEMFEKEFEKNNKKYMKKNKKMERFLYRHKDGTYSIGKDSAMIASWSKKQLKALYSEIEAEILMDWIDKELTK